MSTGLQRITINTLLISCTRMSFDIYIDEIARLSSARNYEESTWYKGIVKWERDRWQLITDLTLEECNNNEYEFFNQESSAVGGTINRIEEFGENMEKEERRNDRVTGPLLDTPPQRVFSELVDVIKKYREGVEEDVERDIITSKKLQKDNVTTEEVVKIINDQRDEMKNVPKMKIPYERYTVLSPPLLGWETSKKNVEALMRDLQ
ncbi:hypothetical protein RhiirA4_548215 [Rhizophagus irregularis]|uniref:Uncharacterized protein n=1 Tax=Rhizophagus irregularis TaxID=588596 RepID=A0A2I1H6B7_9GLOM|nr:hypothetical protein RhiirA4_548215 [Rhizophagus irregularis]